MKRAILAVVFMALPALAQTAQEAEAKAKAEREATLIGQVTGDAAKAKIEAELAARMRDLTAVARGGFMGAIIKDAPYSATGVTESVHVLADGTRIETHVSYKIFRDGAGRIARQEETKPGSGAFQTVSILDPVAGVSYAIDWQRQTARELPLNMPRAAMATAELKAVVTARGNTVTPVPATAGGGRGGSLMPATSKSSENTRRSESLGSQTMEGLKVEGTRVTTTIAAGSIGNDRAIEIFSERWHSADLGVEVMTKQHDPRTGDSTFRLTGIQRGEPAGYLFQVPAGIALQPKAQ